MSEGLGAFLGAEPAPWWVQAGCWAFVGSVFIRAVLR